MNTCELCEQAEATATSKYCDNCNANAFDRYMQTLSSGDFETSEQSRLRCADEAFGPRGYK
jgi:hypothetical protein